MKRLIYSFAICAVLTFFNSTLFAQNCPNNFNHRSYNNNGNVKVKVNENYDSNQRKQAVFIERNGNGLDWSINYDTRIFAGRNSGPGIRVGIGGTDGTVNNETQSFRNITVPAELNLLTGGGRFSFEFGAGATGIYDTEVESWDAIGLARAGIRIKPKRKGLVFRWAITPHITTDGIELGNTGFSFGWGF